MHVCSAAGAAAMGATCVLGRTGTLVGTHSAKRWPVARHNVTINCTKDGRLTTIHQIEGQQRVRERYLGIEMDIDQGCWILRHFVVEPRGSPGPLAIS